ncbi:MAG: hypothetical protein QW270_05180 [Candidatus Bathyarchaeia archaeon]
MKTTEKLETEELRWQVVKAILDEFPTIREKVKNYLKEQQKPKQ